LTLEVLTCEQGSEEWFLARLGLATASKFNAVCAQAKDAKERKTRDALYGASSYWDARASARKGMARSMWPSNAFNVVWDERQRELIVRALAWRRMACGRPA